MPFCWSMVATTTRRSGSHTMSWVTPILLLIAFSTVAHSMSIPLREVILQWSDVAAPEMLSSGYQRSSRSFNMGPDVV
ncbi:hypothetical protein GCK72_019382 [Caenorhabditis remanei]|uniref:Uncharacterized protein n=1 Tax=Caenorhabditis remanei TaxID=31234 RepID=A0A6A5GC53_CAERE|nr:hypothetical protein GCK72_019382 [Caenorhabditis remanei]KAF1752827.1 hypothetical protein GCK72_019382 [Caenorhabditis remanei]